MTRCLVLLGLVALLAGCADPASPRRPLTVTPTSLRLFVGHQGQIAVSDEASVVWRSSSPAIASVDNRGMVTGIAGGVASVWAVRGSDSTSASVEVVAVTCAAGPTMLPANAVIAPGDSVRAEARESCSPMPSGFRWISADTTIAVVDARETVPSRSTAVVTAKRPGQVVIIARSIDDPTVDAALALTVRAP